MHEARRHSGRRVVISGLGVVAPNGMGKEPFWQACLAGRSGVGHITRFDATQLPAQVAGEVRDFDATGAGLSADEMRHMDRATQFGLAAARMALQDAGLLDRLTEEERERTGVSMGSALACLEEGERWWARMTERGRSEPELKEGEVVPATLLLSNACASSIAAHHQFYGPCTMIATGCSAGADAIGQAFWQIQEGRAQRMVAGGTDAGISYGVLDVFCVMGALSTKFNETPERASRPYDRGRDGFVMAEGAGVLVLEEHEAALARGAHIYAEILAFHSNSNAYHMTSLPADGAPLQHLLVEVLREAGVRAEHLGYINAHGSSTLPNEWAETAAYKAVFEEQAYRIPISATKSLIGHTQGAASAIETIVTALVLDRQRIPPTINQEEMDQACDLDYVAHRAREAQVEVALTHSSGFGGVNSALLLARADWVDAHEG